ncbi:hypothetical protein [Paenibacillus oleatilyticus]|uniref:Uncharacterized protein n=1 Tax=Paenibacillus oleatilyticus TaxID=2594886 RepID=A0ABV4UVA3_9BACL
MNKTATNEELFRDSVLIPKALAMIEEEARTLSTSSDLIRRLHIAAAKVIHVRLSNELDAVRKEMRRRGIRAEKINISREEAKVIIAEKLARHIRDITEKLRRQSASK